MANAEEGRFETNYTKESGPMLNVSGGFLVRPRIGVGVAVSHYSRSTPVTVEASVPHPFYFNRKRPITGDVGGLTRKELGVHLHASGVFPVSPTVTITLSGGPSYFGVSQDVVTGFAYADAFPFDEARFERAETAKNSRSAIGVNAGGDLAIFLTSRAGIGISAQFARATVDIGFEGYAIGGLSVGEPTDLMYEIVGQTTARLPEERPRYLMGTGTPADLVESVARGVDLFDCVLPTRNGRNGQLFTSQGRLNIKNARYAEDDRPPDPDCCCYTCRTCSRAYLRHLFLAGEINACTLNTLHNLNFYLDTMRRIRDAIAFRTFDTFRQGFLRSASRLSLDS